MDLVLGIYNGYNSIITHKGGIYFFLKSLRKYNKLCKVIILCESKHLSKDLVLLFQQMNVELYTEFDLNKIPIYESCYQNITTDTFIVLNQRYRFVLFNKIIKKINGSINNILLSDTSDVIFQDDPFGIDTGDQLYCAAEKNILSDCNNGSSCLNMSWINGYSYLNGFDVNKFDNKPVLCCGTIIGNYKNVLHYLDFYNEINEYTLLNDQALLNVYVHIFNENIKVYSHAESRILTLDSIIFDDLLKNEEGKIINNKGEIYSIVHQIDRCNFPYMLSLV